MIEAFNLGEVTLQPGQSLTFQVSEPCYRGLVKHREGTGSFQLTGPAIRKRTCPCAGAPSVNYFVDFHANVAVPTGETVGEVQLAFAVDGTILPVSVMRATPAAVEEYFNVGRSTNVPIWCGCCQEFTVVNSGTIPVAVREANLVIDYEG